MKIRDLLRAKGINVDAFGNAAESELPELFESPALVALAVKRCATCDYKSNLAFLRQMFVGTQEEFAELATAAFSGCCEVVEKDGKGCQIYRLAVKYQEETGISACRSCPRYIENLDKQGRPKCKLCTSEERSE